MLKSLRACDELYRVGVNQQRNLLQSYFVTFYSKTWLTIGFCQLMLKKGCLWLQKDPSSLTKEPVFAPVSFRLRQDCAGTSRPDKTPRQAIQDGKRPLVGDSILEKLLQFVKRSTI
jgi:hypothetical protein